MVIATGSLFAQPSADAVNSYAPGARSSTTNAPFSVAVRVVHAHAGERIRVALHAPLDAGLRHGSPERIEHDARDPRRALQRDDELVRGRQHDDGRIARLHGVLRERMHAPRTRGHALEEEPAVRALETLRVERRVERCLALPVGFERDREARDRRAAAVDDASAQARRFLEHELRVLRVRGDAFDARDADDRARSFAGREDSVRVAAAAEALERASRAGGGGAHDLGLVLVVDGGRGSVRIDRERRRERGAHLEWTALEPRHAETPFRVGCAGACIAARRPEAERTARLAVLLRGLAHDDARSSAGRPSAYVTMPATIAPEPMRSSRSATTPPSTSVVSALSAER